MHDFTEMTPSQIDQLWLTDTEPLRQAREQLYAARAKLRKYEKHGQSPDWIVERIEKLEGTVTEQQKVEEPYLAEWDRRNGWTRAYLVPDGHIHKSTSCSTLYPTTLISWLPEQSGWDEEQIVEAAGTMACTVCYPSAPVAELRAAEAAAKAEGECPGSRTYDYEAGSWKQTSYTGSGRAKCRHCGEHVGTSKTHKLRAHKRAEVTA